MMKKKFLIVGGITTLIILITCLFGIILNNKKQINVITLEKITPLLKSDSAKATEMIKKNIVKVINKLDDDTSIIGTGFFHESGYLITNSHIVDIKGEISIEYSDGEIMPANLISNDILSDISLIAVENSKVKAMSFANTLNLKITDDVYAIGYAYSLEGEASVTKGILSARRSAAGIEFLQSDISLNTGNSGGPLINDKGELLGINTYATDNASIGMSISSESLEKIINELISDKNINYLKEERENNVLSVVLKEIGHETDDLYSEKEIIKEHVNEKDKENDITEKVEKDNSNKKENHDKQNNKQEETTKNKNINIIPNKDLTIDYKKDVPNEIKYYFDIQDNLGCKLDNSSINTKKPGIYIVTVECEANKSSVEVKVNEPKKITISASVVNGVSLPEIIIDETRTNVTNPEQVAGTWYYPGYSDVCLKIFYDIDVWMYTAIGYDPSHNRLQANYGGGGTITTDMGGLKLWISGNYIVYSSNNATHVLTRTRGDNVYGSNSGSNCT